MIPQKQEVFEDGKGDCFRTCIACLLDEHVLQVPNFNEVSQNGSNADLVNLANDWLRKNHNLELFGIHSERYPGLDNLVYTLNGHYVIVTGPSFRKNKYHAIICKVDRGELVMVHDPHPDNTGLKLDAYYYKVYILVRKQC